MRFGALVVLALSLAAVMGTLVPGAKARQGSLSDEFSRASAEYGVPEELLMAMGYIIADAVKVVSK